ncbi:hypothetical protein ACFL6G_01005 [candidate division KSB1 bacterium]
MKKKAFTLSALLLILVLISINCETSMDIKNQNNPDMNRILFTSRDYEDLIGGAFLDFWTAWMKGNHPVRARSFLGDNLTTSWCTEVYGLLKEPREPFNNNNNSVNEQPWKYTYRAISAANDGLNAVRNGIIVEESIRSEAYARFIQGISYGALGMFFDKAFIIDETVDIEKYDPQFVPWNELILTGIDYLEQCIDLCDNSFTTPDSWINGFPMTNVYLKELCHSLIARFLATSPRTSTGRASVDWNSVLQHLDQGITEDFAPEGDDEYWYSQVMYQSNWNGWDVVSNRLHGPSDTSENYENWLATPVHQRREFLNYSSDRRITGSVDDPMSDGKYVEYLDTQFYPPNRGTYFYSSYIWTKHSYHYPVAVGPMPYFNMAEMDMLRAEALMRTGGSRAQIAELINKTRVGIGEMPPLDGSEPDIDLWKALCYEKRIETIGSEPGINLWDYRGWSDFDFLHIPSGTLVHFPIPNNELEILRMDYYTFGGTGNTDTTPSVKDEKHAINCIK